MTMKVNGFQIDVARQIERPEVLHDAVETMAACGYNACMLYLEDAYQYPRHPGVARRHAYSVEEMQLLQARCARHRMELIPVIPALGHCAYITTKKGYERYDEERDAGGVCGSLSPSFPETYTMLRELFEDWCRHMPGRYLHAGLDESAAMGRHHIRTHGREGFDAAGMFAAHANKLAQIARDLGRRLIIWGDMLYYMPAAIERMDKDIIVADWYYYVFPDTPRVEAFNFADIDSAGILKRAGFEVWGSPSVWPNKPLPDIAERWGNLQSWLRYGKRCGIDGIMNTDWENSIGFYATADLQVRLFARQMAAPASTPLADTLTAVLADDYGVRASGKLAADILAMGRHHVDGRNVGRYLHRPLTAWLSANEQEVSRRHLRELDGMFGDIGSHMAAATTPRGRELLEGIRLAWTLTRLYWKLRASLPDAARSLVAADAAKRVSEVRASFQGWVGELGSFRREYEAHWQKTRYEDDPKPAAAWAARAAQTLAEWAGALGGALGEHPVVKTLRLETRLQCRHPALPVVRISITWADGTVQTEGETMIRFESAFAAPDGRSNEPSCLPLTRSEWPTEVRFETVCYGEAGIDEVAVVWGGEKRRFRVSRLEGKCAASEGNTVWIGKRGATVESPLELEEKDSAWYVPEGK